VNDTVYGRVFPLPIPDDLTSEEVAQSPDEMVVFLDAERGAAIRCLGKFKFEDKTRGQWAKCFGRTFKRLSLFLPSGVPYDTERADCLVIEMVRADKGQLSFAKAIEQLSRDYQRIADSQKANFEERAITGFDGSVGYKNLTIDEREELLEDAVQGAKFRCKNAFQHSSQKLSEASPISFTPPDALGEYLCGVDAGVKADVYLGFDPSRGISAYNLFKETTKKLHEEDDSLITRIRLEVFEQRLKNYMDVYRRQSK